MISMLKKLSVKNQKLKVKKGISLILIVVLLSIALTPVLPPIDAKAATLTYTSDWIGNTYGGSNSRWIQMDIDEIFVRSDGRVFSVTSWEEGTHEATVYSETDGTIKGWINGSGVHGYCSKAVAADNNYIYLGVKNSSNYYVRRYSATNYSSAPFTNGVGTNGDCILIGTTGQAGAIAVRNGKLYVSVPSDNKIRVYNTSDMSFSHDISVTSPGKLTVDNNNYVWVIQTSTNKILKYSSSGTKQSTEISGLTDPTAIAASHYDTSKLLVADSGSGRNHIRIYNISGTSIPSPTTFGSCITSGTPGLVAPTKFDHITGVGQDTSGNYYVACNGAPLSDGTGAYLRKLTSTGSLVWEDLGLEFTDGADVDPNTGDLYTKDSHYTMDFSKPNGNQWTWKGYTLDRFRYPDDPRLKDGVAGGIKHPNASYVRRLNGQLFMFVTDMFFDFFVIYRFEGEIAVPCVMFNRKTADTYPPNKPSGGWIWRDLDKDGQFDSGEYNSTTYYGSNHGYFVDTTGDIWFAVETDNKVVKFDYLDLDANGIPRYNSTPVETTAPSPINKLQRAEYIADKDIMFLGGYTTDRPKTGSESNIVGTEVLRYDNWSTSPTLKSRCIVPYDGSVYSNCSKSMTVSPDGKFVFSVKHLGSPVTVFDTETGSEIGTITSGSETGGRSGNNDLAFAIRSYKRTTSEYIILVEEDERAKIIMYRWTPDAQQLSRSGWTANSSSTSSAYAALDGNISSRWDSKASQTNGQYYLVDMKKEKTISKIVLDAGSYTNDYPRQYAVYVSKDGTNWGSAVATGSGSTVTTITFTAADARYVKVVQTGTASNYWSICEFNVYGF